MMTKNNFRYFLKPTIKFSIVGIFIPGFTAILIMVLLLGLTYLGVECRNSWTILWIASFIGMLILPIYFLKRLRKTIVEGYDLNARAITIFNVLEYIFIQCAFSVFVSNARTLCYVSDGQNGIQFVFTAWMGIPIIILLSLIFDSKRKKMLHELWPEKIPQV